MVAVTRSPDSLTITIKRGPLVVETAIELIHHEDGLSVVIFDDWSPTPDRLIAHMIERAVEVWVRNGPLACASWLATL